MDRCQVCGTVGCSVDPVVAEVYAHGGEEPGGGGVPGQGVEAVVLVDVDVGRAHAARHQHPAHGTVVAGAGPWRYSLHHHHDEAVHHAQHPVIQPRPVPLHPLEAPLQEDEAEEVWRRPGHEGEGDGGQVGVGGLAGGGHVEHPPQALNTRQEYISTLVTRELPSVRHPTCPCPWNSFYNIPKDCVLKMMFLTTVSVYGNASYLHSSQSRHV